MSHRIADSLKDTGYSQEEAYFFEENKKKILELRKHRERQATESELQAASEEAEAPPTTLKKAA